MPRRVPRLRLSRARALLAGVVVAQCFVSAGEAGEARTRVILNGVPTPVVFNDGDSFRVLGGAMTGAKARLAGFNTLESHGPVHQWGTWTAKELYVIAKMATYFARDNVWECTTDGKTDGYGRMLVLCPGLAKEQVRRGFAHAMSVNDAPASAELMALQREAIAARRGIWAHGIPDYILTSLHSIEEDVEDDGVYNRLVSSADGHSVKWTHETKYEECQNVCHLVYPVEDARVEDVLGRLKREQAPLVAGMDDAALRKILREFARHRHVTTPAPAAAQLKLQALLLEWASAGAFGSGAASEEACMVHVDFKRRYGAARALCLR